MFKQDRISGGSETFHSAKHNLIPAFCVIVSQSNVLQTNTSFRIPDLNARCRVSNSQRNELSLTRSVQTSVCFVSPLVKFSRSEARYCPSPTPYVTQSDSNLRNETARSRTTGDTRHCFYNPVRPVSHKNVAVSREKTVHFYDDLCLRFFLILMRSHRHSSSPIFPSGISRVRINSYPRISWPSPSWRADELQLRHFFSRFLLVLFVIPIASVSKTISSGVETPSRF